MNGLRGGKSGEDSITFMTDTKRENSAVPILQESCDSFKCHLGSLAGSLTSISLDIEYRSFEKNI